MFSSTVARFILLTVFTKFDFLAEVVTDLNVVRGPAVIQQKEEEKHERHHNGFSMKVTARKPFQKAVYSRLKPCVVAGCEKKEQKVRGGRQVGGRQAASSAGKVLDERKQEEQAQEQEEEQEEEAGGGAGGGATGQTGHAIVTCNLSLLLLFGYLYGVWFNRNISRTNIDL